MSLYEYEMKMKAFKLAQVDKELDMHMQAWLNHQVTLTKEHGKKQVPVYREFKQFFNYEKRLKEIKNPSKKVTPRMRALAKVAKKANERR